MDVPITLDIFLAGSGPIESMELFEELELCLCLFLELLLLLAELVVLAPIHIFKGCITLLPPGGAIDEDISGGIGLIFNFNPPA